MLKNSLVFLNTFEDGYTFQNLLNSCHLFFILLKLLSAIAGQMFSDLVMSMWVLTQEHELQLSGPTEQENLLYLILLMVFCPLVEEIRRSQKLRIGRYFELLIDLLTIEETPVQYFLRLHLEQEGFSKQEVVRAKLGKFGLPNHIITPQLQGLQEVRRNVLFSHQF